MGIQGKLNMETEELNNRKNNVETWHHRLARVHRYAEEFFNLTRLRDEVDGKNIEFNYVQKTHVKGLNTIQQYSPSDASRTDKL